MFNALISLITRDEEGQGLAEYALILALIAIVAIVALIFLGGQVSQHPVDGRQLDLGRDATNQRLNAGCPSRQPASSCPQVPVHRWDHWRLAPANQGSTVWVRPGRMRNRAS